MVDSIQKLRRPKADDCIIDDFFGSGHPYNYCISPADDVLDKSGSRKNCDWLGANCIQKNMAGFGKYLNGLFVGNPKKIIDTKCGQKLGNKYILKTNATCIDHLTDEEVDRYIYINNIENKFFGMTVEGDNMGILPLSFNKATRVNPVGLFSALIGTSKPKCKKVKLKCHILNKYKKLYEGDSDYVNLSVDDIGKINQSDIVTIIEDNNHPDYASEYSKKETFSNINKNLYNIPNNESNNDNKNYMNNDNKNLLNESYYFLLALILLYIIYKMIHKK